MNPVLQVAVLSSLGTMAVRLAVTDEHLRFVKASLAPFLLVVGVALVLLALARGWYEVRAELAAGDEGRASGSGSHSPRIGVLLLLPVAVVFVVAPPPLGSFAAERTAAREPPPAERYEVPLPDAGPDGYRETSLGDYTARAYWEVEPSWEGEPVRMTGFVTPVEGGWALTRMQIACCAADGAPLKVLVRGAQPPPRDTWVRLDGTGVGSVTDAAEEAGALGEVVAEQVTPVPAPASPYE